MELKIRRSLFFRSLWIPALWSDRSGQARGFDAALEPWRERLRGEKHRMTEALKEPLRFFNTQAHLLGFALGVVARMEKENASRERIEKVKDMLGPALAGVGDPFFWGGLRPAAAFSAAAVFWMTAPEAAAWGAPLIYLALFNCGAMIVRWKGLERGYAAGENGLLKELGRVPWRRGTNALRGMSFAAALFAAAVFSMLWSGPALEAILVVGFAAGLKARAWRTDWIYGVALMAALLRAAAGG